MTKFAEIFLSAINLFDDDNDSYLFDHQKTEDREVNWLDLPDHILTLIAYRLIHDKDLIRFSAVCHPWQSIYADILHRRSRRIPLLMLSTEIYHDLQTRSLYNITNHTLYDVQVPIPHNVHCLGSSHGWLVAVSPQTLQVRLFNPLLSSNNEIPLPPLTTFQHATRPGFLRKAVLSTNPSSDPNYVLMAIMSSTLAFYKPGGNTWISIDSQYNGISDVIYYRDQFYVVDIEGKVFSFDFNHREVSKVSTVALYSPNVVIPSPRRYLVESLGDLLQVVRYDYYEDRPGNPKKCPANYFTNSFDVFKLDSFEQTWVKLDNLGGRILFLGDNSSLSASDFPEYKPNSIYFTDDLYSGFDESAEDCEVGGHDMGVYILENSTIYPHYPMDYDVEMMFPTPIWIEPPLLDLSVNAGVGISKGCMDIFNI